MKHLYDWHASGQPAVAGWSKVPTYAQGFFTPDRTRGQKNLVQQLATRHTQNVPMIWNVEHWPMPAEQHKLIEIIRWAREARPDLRQGIYALAPMRSYWAPVELYFQPNNAAYRRRYDDWLRLNEQMQPLAKEVDFVCPSIYAFYRDGDGTIGRHDEFWFPYAESNIAEAKKYGKEVIAFTSPRLWAVPGYPPMSLSFYEQQIRFAAEHADGVFSFDWVGMRPQLDLASVYRKIVESAV
jgi:hypothetical protein